MSDEITVRDVGPSKTRPRHQPGEFTSPYQRYVARPGLQGPQGCRQRSVSKRRCLCSICETAVNPRPPPPPPRRAFPEASPPLAASRARFRTHAYEVALPRSVRLLPARMRTAISIFPPAGLGIYVLYARDRSSGGCGGKLCCVMIRCKPLAKTLKTLSPLLLRRPCRGPSLPAQVFAPSPRRGARARAGTGGVYS